MKIKKSLCLTVALAVVLFVSGGIAGFSLGRLMVPRHRMPMQMQPGNNNQSPDRIKTMMSNRMAKRLHLTLDQQQLVSPAVDRWFDRMSELRRRHVPEFQAVFNELFDRIDTVLTPEQKPELEKLRKEAMARAEGKRPNAKPGFLHR